MFAFAWCLCCFLVGCFVCLFVCLLACLLACLLVCLVCLVLDSCLGPVPGCGVALPEPGSGRSGLSAQAPRRAGRLNWVPSGCPN